MWNRQTIKRILLKGYQDLRLRAVVTGMFAFVWWGILYPDLCFTDSTYTQVRVEDGQEMEAEKPDIRDFLQMDGDEIVIKSRLLEWIEQKISKKNRETIVMNDQEELCNRPIGVFDSGVGGLTVAREIMRQLPNERIVYFGDTARVPYGNKSPETITKFSRQIVRFLQTQNVKAIVVACNSASACAVSELEKEVELPIIDVVRPGARTAIDTTKNDKIGVIATEATIGSGIYSRYIKENDAGAMVLSKACPLFVPLVEEGLWEDPVTDEIAGRYLAELIDVGIDTLILGCTHYPIIRSTIGRIMGEGVALVNPAYETARELKHLLREKGLESGHRPGLGTELYRFFVSDAADKFQKFANSILTYGILSAKVINIEEY